ncbi:hypothetical protein Q7P37_010861 [Cladosporium fusiforme]
MTSESQYLFGRDTGVQPLGAVEARVSRHGRTDRNVRVSSRADDRQATLASLTTTTQLLHPPTLFPRLAHETAQDVGIHRVSPSTPRITSPPASRLRQQASSNTPALPRSRISLISKSDIKYVGTLHEINSETSTIALENVTSYGTEGRRGDPTQEVPGSDQIYEYIVFRGSDVKELSMVEAPKENQAPAMPNDPAIMGSTRPPQQQQPAQPGQQQPQFRNQQQQQPPYPPYGFPPGPPGPQGPPQQQFQQQSRFQAPGGPHGFPGSPGSIPGYGMGFGPPPPGYGMPPYGPPPPGQGFPPPPPGAFSPNNAPMPIGPPGQQRPQIPEGPGPAGSKQGTPQPAGGEAHQPPPVQNNMKPVEMPSTPAAAPAAQPAGPPPPVESKPSPAAATAPAPVPAQAPQQTAAKKAANSRVALPLPAPNAATKPAPKQAAAAPPQAASQPEAYADATHAATAAVAAAMAKLPTAGQQQQQPTGVNMDNLTQKVNQMRVQDAPARGRGRGRGRGGPAGGRRESAHKPMEVPTEDYDFESANAKFNKQDLIKQQIATGSPVTTPQNGDIPDPMSNGHNETEEVVIPAKPGAEKGYDKQSSFFDNISSDLKDRMVTHGETIDGRALRRDERNKNVDTFGQGSVDTGYRGGFRGRGRGRGFSRGGPRGGFRGAPRGAPRGRGGLPTEMTSA